MRLSRVVGRILPALLIGSAALCAHAADLGVRGQVWDIAEEDAIARIKRILGEMDKRGEIRALQERHREAVLNTVQRPKPVPGISTASANKTWYFDPTVSFAQDIVDEASGKVIWPKGKSINPFDFQTLDRRYLFIDARDARQVAWAKRELDSHPKDATILVGGDWIKLSKDWGQHVYYDQMDGMLTKHFGIRTVPAVLSQEGRRVRIDEVKP